MTSLITYTIPGFPLLNQRIEVSNANDDCVFTSCAAIVRALTGNKTITGSQIKVMDNNYGPSYVGFASAANLVDTLDRLGVTLVRKSSGTQAGLVTLLHSELAAGHPALVTMPSQWNSAPLIPKTGKLNPAWNPRTYRGYSHVGAACGLGKNSSGQGMIRVMNPWGGFWQDATDGWWRLRLLMGDIWVASKKPVVVVASAPAAAAPASAAATTTAATTTATLTDAEKLAEIAKILAR